jgi:AcrR family transcriptional regulator
LAGLRDPETAAAAAVQEAVPPPPGGVGQAPRPAEPDPAEPANVQVMPLVVRSTGGEPRAADTVAADPADPVEPAVDAATAPSDAPVATPSPADAPGPGRRPRRRERRGPTLREQRRLRTRDAIVDAAAELFTERGFDHVSVMEIAQRAGVVEKTVFNHFPVKEGLVFDADPPMRAALLDAVRRRPAGESVSAAAGSFVVAAVSLLGSPEASEGVARMARIIRGSRTLQVREREILGELTNSLAELIAEETSARPGQVEPWLAAHAVLGLYASLLELARDRVLAGVEGLELSAELRRQGRRGLSLLQFGLAGYAKRR